MKRSETSKSLARFRARASLDPFFLGHALTRFASERGLGDTELAEFLGCSIDQLPHVMACRSPDPEAQRFAADIRKIAEYAGCNEHRLLVALRELSVISILRLLPDTTKELPAQLGLLAARQHRSKPPSKSKRGDHDDRPRGT